MAEEITPNIDDQVNESALYPGSSEDNSNKLFSERNKKDTLETLSDNDNRLFLNLKDPIGEKETNENPIKHRVDFGKILLFHDSFFESSYFEDIKRNLIDVLTNFEEQSYFLTTFTNTIGNYSWTSKELIKYLIGSKFTIKNENEALEFLINNSDHCSKILEFSESIANHLNKYNLELEYICDPEEGVEILNMKVLTNLSATEAIEIEERFFYEYFEEIFQNDNFKLNFRIESNAIQF